MSCCCENKNRAPSGASCCGAKRSRKIGEGTLLAISLASLLASFAISFFGLSFPWFPLSDPAWIAVVLCGFPLVRSAAESLFRRRKITSPLLISIAIFASLALQFFMTFSCGDSGTHSHDSYIFAAGEIAFLMALGEMLEERTVKKSREGIEALVKISPKTALRRRADGEEENVSAESLEIGDVVIVRPGDMIPADGEIVEGASAVNQAGMTGESVPVDKARGDAVLAGTWNISGAISVRVGKRSGDTVIARLVRLVEEAEAKKAPIENVADRWAGRVVPVAIACAVAVFVFAFWILEKDFATSLIRGVTILVVFCPCAFALATPTAIAAGIGNAARRGILIKSGAALEKLAGVGAVAFDKTGTLTRAELKVEAVFSAGTLGEKEIVALCAAAEKRSQHPIASAILAAAGETTLPSARNISAQNGIGISCDVGNAEVKICSRAGAISAGISLERAAADFCDAHAARGETLVCLAVDGALAGIIALSDTLRDGVSEMLAEMRVRGIETAMLTGDNRAAGAHFARLAGVGKVFAEQLPADKAESVSELRSRAGKSGGRGGVLMVGDGVNDAPALASADCSIAMGALGSELAVETADIAILNDNVALVGGLMKFSGAVLRTIHANFAISLCINFCAVVLSAAGILDPVSGAIVHNASSVLVVLNSASLLARGRDFSETRS